MTEELKSKLKKIQVLAQRGVGGEAESAKKKLEQLLRNNGLTEKDLDSEKVNYYLFSYSGAPYRYKLLSQIIYKVMGNNEGFHVYKSRYTRNKLGIYCTPAQKIEIDLDYEFYSNLFDEEIDIFLSAFIDKQHIFPEDVPTVELNLDELTSEEIEKFNKKIAYESNISKRSRPTGLIEDKSNHEK